MTSSVTLILFTAFYTHSAYCGYYHGPTAKPVVLHNGYLADTHDVAAAKTVHLAALVTQHSHGADYGYEGSYGKEHSVSHGDIRYHGPTAIPHVLHDGHIADTHEVAAAKAEHLATVAKAKAHGGYGEEHSSSHGDLRYHGPTAIPHVLHDGHIEDTDEVAAAKAEHLATVAKAKAHGGYGEEHSSSHGDLRYHGPTAIPHVLHDGHIADTHEVAAAKAEHLATIAKAKAHRGYGDHSGYGAEHGHSNSATPHHRLIAEPVVLKSGYLADTHEASAARKFI